MMTSYHVRQRNTDSTDQQKSHPMKPNEIGRSTDGNELLLGWTKTAATDQKPAIGFCPQGTHQTTKPRRMLTYKGDQHLLCVAPTGAGRGRGLIIPNLLHYRGPVIVTDPKGENYQVTAKRRRDMGHKVIALDPFGIATDRSDRLNPLDILNLPGATGDADCEMLSELLHGGEATSSKEPFWDLTSGGLLTGLIGLTVMEENPKNRNLGTLLDLLYDGECDYKIAVALDSKTFPERLIYNELAAYLSNESDKCRPSIKSTAQAKVKALGCQAVRNAMTDSTFDLSGLVKGDPLDIFLILPMDKVRSHRAVLRLWMGVLMTALVRRPSIPNQQTLILLDEVAQLGSLDVLRQALTLLRGSGVQVWTFWQDLSQLKRLYPEDWASVLNNSGIIQAFGVSNGLMANDCAAVLGCQPRDVMRLTPDRQLILRPRRAVHTGTRLDYLRDRRFRDQYTPNPRHERTKCGR
jgi:type IV secretion system protein VirD4